MTRYEMGGPKRFAHQRRGLNKLINTGGIGALLFDPGLGKTATVLDYAGLLALKSTRGEARVLVVAPLAAVDTWVMQAETFVSPMVNYWAEALGGSLLECAEAMASRGGNPHKVSLVRPTPPPWIIREEVGMHTQVECRRCLVVDEETGEVLQEAKYVDTNGIRADDWWLGHMRTEHAYRPVPPKPYGPRALHHGLSIAWGARSAERERPVTASEGPDGLGDARPRIVLEVINIDKLAYRTTIPVPGRFGWRNANMADVMVDAIKRFDPDLVVVDESHKIKSNMGNASRLLGRVTKFVKRRIILTGTVMPHSPLDVFGQWRFLEPYAFGDVARDGTRKEATYGGFRNRYAILGGWMGKEVISFDHLDEMQAIMAKNAIVARKADALDLPSETDITVPVHLSPAETKAYAEMRDQLATMLANGQLGSVTSRLTQMLRLRQITAGHMPEDNGPMRIIGSSKAQVIRSLVHDTLVGEKRIVVFAYFTPEIAMLSKVLKAKPGDEPTEIMTITGSTPTAERTAMRKRFGPEGPQDVRIVMIAQIKTMSLAVNELVTASHAIFGSLSQQRDDLVQARDRLARIGQTKPMTFWYAIAPGTIDEVILKSHRDRTNLEDAMLHHIQHGPARTPERIIGGDDPLAQEAVRDALAIFGGA